MTSIAMLLLSNSFWRGFFIGDMSVFAVFAIVFAGIKLRKSRLS